MASKDLARKLTILADAAKYDASCASSGAKRGNNGKGIGHTTGSGICHSYTPDGRCVSLLKILLTNFCIFDCQFCINRISSSTPRARFSPEEVVALTMSFYRRNYIEGLFLSSGIIQSPDYTQEQINAVIRTLRERESFGGYIHVKAIPGAAPELLAEAGRYADRLSANIELPRERDLSELAPAKSHAVIEKAMADVKRNSDELASHRSRLPAHRRPRFAPAGQSTQLIVGATAASDRDILGKSTELYRAYGLRRIYYSAFSPIPDSSPGLASQAAPLIREHRLYQADWLFRYYGFEISELLDEQTADLSLERDPKFAWALKHRSFFPVDVNRAAREVLLRVPGFGTKVVAKILQARKFSAIRFEDLARMRVPLNRARYFISTGEANPALRQLSRLTLEEKPQQLDLFSIAASTVSGEL